LALNSHNKATGTFYETYQRELKKILWKQHQKN
jgi:hypothetical protein